MKTIWQKPDHGHCAQLRSGQRPDIAAMIGASATLCVSDIPFYQPIGGIRVGRINGEFVVNPTAAELEESELNIIMAASKDAILMVEGEAKEVSEEVMLMLSGLVRSRSSRSFRFRKS